MQPFSGTGPSYTLAGEKVEACTQYGWASYYAADGRHFVPVHPECFQLTMVKRPPEPKELERYRNSWEGMPQMSKWDKFWSGIR